MAVDGRIRLWRIETRSNGVPPWDTSARLRGAARNRLLREALSAMLLKSGELK